jgi:hypothetical protein
VRLVSLAAQKFLEGVLEDALILARQRGAPAAKAGGTKRTADGRDKERRLVLKHEDVAAALAQRAPLGTGRMARVEKLCHRGVKLWFRLETVKVQ